MQSVIVWLEMWVSSPVLLGNNREICNLTAGVEGGRHVDLIYICSEVATTTGSANIRLLMQAQF